MNRMAIPVLLTASSWAVHDRRALSVKSNDMVPLGVVSDRLLIFSRAWRIGQRVAQHSNRSNVCHTFDLLSTSLHQLSASGPMRAHFLQNHAAI